MQNIPILDSTENSLELIKVFTPQFYEYLRGNSDSLQTLLLLYRSGNEKAGEVITYLMGTTAHILPVFKEKNQKTLKETFSLAAGNVYNIVWSEPIINSLLDKKFVEFEVEAFFKNELTERRIVSYHLSHTFQFAFRKEFLEKDIAKWLQDKGYRFRKSDPRDINKGALYGDSIVEYFGSKENPEDNNQKICNHAKMTCRFEILPI